MTAIKKTLRWLVAAILRLEAQLILRKYRPRVVGVTGNVGKTSTKDAIYTVLRQAYSTRRSDKSFNSEIGVPLTILGGANAWSNPIAWLQVFFEGLGLILFRQPYPEWLVLEIGADRPGDIGQVVKWIKFEIVVVTRLPDLPVHVEFFPSPAALIEEKLKLPLAVDHQGVVILNYDDQQVMAVAPQLHSRLLTYGFQSGANVLGSNDHVYYQGGKTGGRPEGVAFKVDYGGHNVPVRLPGVLGHHQLYAVLAAIAVGLAERLNLVTIIEALAKLEQPAGRMRLIPGLKDTLIIDDSYNASPAAVAAALETLHELAVPGRKIAVLGDMLELGAHSVEAHRAVGALVARSAEILVTVGLRAKFIAEIASKKKMGKRQLYHFPDAISAGKFLQNFIKLEDVILIKGSQSMRLEKVVEEIMAQPELKTKLLARQEPEWQRR